MAATVAKMRRQYAGEKIAVGQDKVKTLLNEDADLRGAIRQAVMDSTFEPEREEEPDLIPQEQIDEAQVIQTA